MGPLAYANSKTEGGRTNSLPFYRAHMLRRGWVTWYFALMRSTALIPLTLTRKLAIPDGPRVACGIINRIKVSLPNQKQKKNHPKIG